jgi:hypothetical protein
MEFVRRIRSRPDILIRFLLAYLHHDLCDHSKVEEYFADLPDDEVQGWLDLSSHMQTNAEVDVSFFDYLKLFVGTSATRVQSIAIRVGLENEMDCSEITSLLQKGRDDRFPDMFIARLIQDRLLDNKSLCRKLVVNSKRTLYSCKWLDIRNQILATIDEYLEHVIRPYISIQSANGQVDLAKWLQVRLPENLNRKLDDIPNDPEQATVQIQMHAYIKPLDTPIDNGKKPLRNPSPARIHQISVIPWQQLAPIACNRIQHLKRQDAFRDRPKEKCLPGFGKRKRISNTCHPQTSILPQPFKSSDSCPQNYKPKGVLIYQSDFETLGCRFSSTRPFESILYKKPPATFHPEPTNLMQDSSHSVKTEEHPADLDILRTLKKGDNSANANSADLFVIEKASMIKIQKLCLDDTVYAEIGLSRSKKCLSEKIPACKIVTMVILPMRISMKEPESSIARN